MSNKLIDNKYFGLCFDVIKFRSENLVLNFNKSYVIYKGIKIKLKHSREFDLLCYISKYSKLLEMRKNSNFIFDSYLITSLFPSKKQKMKRVMYPYIREIEDLFSNDDSRYVRIYFIKTSTFFADSSFIRLELANYLYTDLKINNKDLVNKINEYYALSNNLQNMSILNKNHITPHKSCIEYINLPSKLFDKNFTNLAKNPKYEYYIIYELFINNYVDNRKDLNSMHSHLEYFREIINSTCEQDNYSNSSSKTHNMEYLINYRRRQARIDIKKYFRPRDKNLVRFFDVIVYIINDYQKFKQVVDDFINHLEKFYTSDTLDNNIKYN